MVKVYSLDKKADVFVRETEKIAAQAVKFFNQNISANIYFVNSRRMAALNWRFRRKKGTTNILSFVEPVGFPHPESKTKMVGEIYLDISQSANFLLLKEKKKEAAGKISLNHLIVHGVLHLFGYGHATDAKREKMEAAEKRFLRSLPSGE